MKDSIAPFPPGEDGVVIVREAFWSEECQEDNLDDRYRGAGPNV